MEKLQRNGVNAVGLSGLDGRIWEGVRKATITILEAGKKKVLRDDFTGKVEKVNLGLIHLLLNGGFTPVLTPPAISYEGEAINVDGDRAAAMLASALKVDKLIILSNVPGLLRDVQDEGSLIPDIPFEHIEEFAAFAKGPNEEESFGCCSRRFAKE